MANNVTFAPAEPIIGGGHTNYLQYLNQLRRQQRPAGTAQRGYDYRDRANIESQKYHDQANLIAQRQAAQMAQMQAPSQGERLEMMRLQHGLAGVQHALTAGILDPEEAAAMQTQIMTKINPYLVKQQNYQAQLAQQKYMQFLDDAHVQAMANDLHRKMMNSAGDNGLLTLDDPNNPGKKMVLTFDQHGKATLLHSGKDAAAKEGSFDLAKEYKKAGMRTEMENPDLKTDTPEFHKMHMANLNSQEKANIQQQMGKEAAGALAGAIQTTPTAQEGGGFAAPGGLPAPAPPKPLPASEQAAILQAPVPPKPTGEPGPEILQNFPIE